MSTFGRLFLFGFAVTLTITIFTTVTGGGSVEDALFGILDYEVYPRELLFISLGCMLLLYVLMVKKMEYISEEQKEKVAKKTLFFRRFGIVTLTLYMVEPLFNGLFATIFHLIFNGGVLYDFGTPDPYMSNLPAILLFEATILTFWFVAVYFWSKTRYKFGFEYWIIRISKPFRKVKTKRLQLDFKAENDEKIEQKQN